jgi:hypothetical protein
MRRFLSNPTVRGLALVAAVSLAIVFFSLEPAVATVGGILGIAFYLAVAFFLFLLWRERRSEIETWSDRSRRVFYGAIGLAVVDVGMLIGLSPSGPDAAVFVVVLLACAWALWRVWRSEHRYA